MKFIKWIRSKFRKQTIEPAEDLYPERLVIPCSDGTVQEIEMEKGFMDSEPIGYAVSDSVPIPNDPWGRHKVAVQLFQCAGIVNCHSNDPIKLDNSQ